jgi:CarD family transcriptional regulator
MEKFDEVEWVSIIKTVYRRKQDKRLMDAELAYCEKAKDYLHGEISVLLEMPADKVEEHIAQAVDASW